MDPIIYCSSSPETHHSAADVLQNVHFEVYMDAIIDCSSFLETYHSAADVLQNAESKSTWMPSETSIHFWKSIIPLQTSRKMLMLRSHGSHHRLQFVSEKPSFRCGRLAKCWECVHVGSTMCCITISRTLPSAAGISKNVGMPVFDVFEIISV